ncbi:MAG: DMT family transporter [Verrucomicrobia bacterium]|nr:DMT family transporter [Verrucomicrobiota bacterium]MCF7709361.1 DMT family transporter [Verrucomicrobiota bacterium]
MAVNRYKAAGLTGLIFGAAGIGFAPIFVRLSEVGPVTTAFYRILFALPLLWIWLAADISPGRKRSEKRPRNLRMSDIWLARWTFAAVGFFFAGDLAVWHWSLNLTTVANSTLLTNFAPIFVISGARIFLKEEITPSLVFGFLIAIAGGAILINSSLDFSIRNVYGDILALVTAMFYACYILTVKKLRADFPPSAIMAAAAAVTCLVLFVIALVTENEFMPQSNRGWLILAGLALISHIGGQGLIAYSLAHLSAGFSSVTLLLQPVIASILAWIILSEPLSTKQVFGGVLVLIAITIASSSEWKKKNNTTESGVKK